MVFDDQATQELTIRLEFHQQAADELGGDDLSRAAKESLGEDWEGVVAMGVALGVAWWAGREVKLI